MTGLDRNEAGEGRCQIIIATLLHRRGETGIQTHFNTLAEHLSETGRRVAFVNHRSRFRAAATPLLAVRRLIDPISGSASVWWYREWHYWLLRAALARLLRSHPPVVIYAQCPLSAWAALRTRRASDQKVVLAVHFSHSQADEWIAKGRTRPGTWIDRQMRTMDARAIPEVDGIVYLSRYMKEYLEREFPALKSMPSIVAPNFVPRPDAVASSGPTRDLITIGALDRNKNQAYLIRVLGEAANQGRRYSLTIVGAGRERGNLEKLATNLGVSSHVRFLGFVRNARTLLPDHRAYAHSALMDNMPLAPIEALAAGLPVLAPAVGGIPEVINDGVEGFFWPLDDPAAGARVLISILEDGPTYRNAAAAARRRFNMEFESSVVAERIARFLCAVGQ